ncbi:protein NPGR1-like isoform X2 [Aristolochia californica]|uniref:protein NPGR1-like isoform X2 n=1 Tax=Aristolochia californica TaxID=171875 RepID=UPI0035DB1713
MALLCACSGEQFKFEEVPQSPESLATRDFSASGLSSRTGDWDSRFEDNQVEDVESTLQGALSLNYEEARALLGRLEYQSGNFDAALQVFHGIDIRNLTPKMSKAIAERMHQRKGRSKGDKSVFSTMSMHSVNLLLEAILLKAKSLEELGRSRESALPNGMLEGINYDCKMQEMFLKALELLPRLWKQAGCLEEAIGTYRRALVKPWNLDTLRLATFQKELSALLLYGGVEASLPSQFQLWSSSTPKSNLEEAILLLFILMHKVAFHQIPWDQEIMEHLTFALSTSGQFEILANHVEQILPGVYNQMERWYLLALCYSAMGQNETAINLLKKGLARSEEESEPHFPSLLLGEKLCSQSSGHAYDGINFAHKAMESSKFSQGNHFLGNSYHLLGISYGNCARLSVSDAERLWLEEQSLKSLNLACKISGDNPEAIYDIGLENLVQRNLKMALENAKLFSEAVGGSSVKGWKLLALTVSAEQCFHVAESIVDAALDESGKRDQLELLRLKGLLQTAQEQPKEAIETYRILMSLLLAHQGHQSGCFDSEAFACRKIEMKSWQDLATIYTKLGSFIDATVCLDKAKMVELYSPRSWHLTGRLLQAQSLYKEALMAFSVSLSIEPDYVPSMVSTAALLRKYGGKSLPIARSFLMNALRLNPRSHDAWLNLGLVLKMEGSLHQAADCFQAAFELEQSCPVNEFV